VVPARSPRGCLVRDCLQVESFQDITLGSLFLNLLQQLLGSCRVPSRFGLVARCTCGACEKVFGLSRQCQRTEAVGLLEREFSLAAGAILVFSVQVGFSRQQYTLDGLIGQP
jgi:hypothetical protein